MKDFLPADLAGTHHDVRFNGVSSKGKLERTGDHRSRKLHVVCKACNSGWMSLLQRDTIPILKPLLTGQRKAMTPKDQAILASWAAMFTMVYEYAEERLIAATQDDRNYLMSSKKAPSHWMIWYGSFNEATLNAETCHRAWKLQSGPVGEVTVSPNYDVQTTIFAAGRVVFQTFSSAVILPDRCASVLRQTASRFKLRRIWPSSTITGRIANPTSYIGDEHLPQIVDHVTNAIENTLRENPGFIFHKRPPIMTNSAPKKQSPPEQELPREDDVLRRMLTTPPKEHEPKPR